MGAIICPTVTAQTATEYKKQINSIASFAQRVHIDLADGVFTSNKLVGLDKVWWPVGLEADLHLMYEAVKPYLDQLIKIKPHMVIVQAEAVGNFYELARPLKKAGIKVGVSLLARTPVSRIQKALQDIDHVLIFSGNLGHFGGKADLSLLTKATQIKQKHPNIELGWDGGINYSNANSLAIGGIDVLNTGGAIQRAANPAEAYARLKALAN